MLSTVYDIVSKTSNLANVSCRPLVIYVAFDCSENCDNYIVLLILQFALLETSSVDDDLANLKKELSSSSKVCTLFLVFDLSSVRLCL